MLEINFNMMEIDREAAKPFFLGSLLAFLVAHILYIRAFCCDPYKIHPFLKLLLILCNVGIMSKLMPNVNKELLFPFLTYSLAISCMVATMIARYSIPEIDPESKFLALMGACFFVLSDYILFVNNFVEPVENARNIVLINYYVAQILIAISTNYDLVDPPKKELVAPAKKVKVKKPKM